MYTIRDLSKHERTFYEDRKGNIKYNKRCYKCARSCKQSWRTKIIQCKMIEAHTPNEYLEEIKNQNKTIQEVAKAIGMNARTLNALLTNPDKDIDYKTHKKLMKYLYKQDI